MKKSALSAFALSSVSLMSSLSFAEETSVAAATPSTPEVQTRSDTVLTQQQLEQIKKELDKKPATQNNVYAYGSLQGNVNTSDSQRNNTPDFQGGHARVGVAAKGGIASGQVEVEFLGNQNLYSDTAAKDPVSGKPLESPSQNNTVALRQAQLNLDVLALGDANSKYVTTVSVGGVRVGGAVATAPDAANGTSGFSRQDGIYVQEKMSFVNQLDLNLGLGAFNILFGKAPGAAYAGWGGNPQITMASPWLSTSLNPSLGYLASLNAAYRLDDARSLNAVAYYGFQKNAPYSTINAGNLSETRDVNHTEASVLYNDTNVFGSDGIISGNGVSVWYEREQNARTQLVAGDLSKGFVYTNGFVDDAQVASLYGVGVAADSKKYLTNMLQSGDRLTGAAAYTLVTSTMGSDSAVAQSYKVHQMAASVGYAVNTFEVAFNVEYSAADTDAFFKNGNGDKRNNETHSYVTAAYNF